MNSGQRDVFPRHDDRVVITAFLAGKKPKHPTPTSMLVIKGTMLQFGGGQTVAWFDEAGNLNAKLATGSHTSYSLLAINHIMAELGQPDKRVVRDEFQFQNYTSRESVRYIFDGAEIAIDAPFTLAGPVGVLAYRASVKSK